MKPTTFAARLQLLRDRYYLLIGPLLLLVGLSSGKSPMLFWTALVIAVILSANAAWPLLSGRKPVKPPAG